MPLNGKPSVRMVLQLTIIFLIIKRVRSHASQPIRSLPALALTAYAMEQDQQQTLAAGFQRHLAKPIEPEALVQAIGDLLKRG